MEARKKLRDLRGPQTRIGRLARFYFESYIHILFYRIMVPLTILYGLSIAAYLLIPGLGTGLKVFTVVVWVMWTPQFYEVAKGLSLAWSRGMAFGHLNKEFAALYRKRYGKRSAGFTAFPYAVLLLWAAGFVILLLRWFP